MQSPKDRIARLALLDRAFGLVSDDELVAMLDALPEEAATAVDGFATSAAPDAADRIAALRTTATKGRMNGNLERITNTISAICLGDCVEALGDNADLPSEDDLRDVIPQRASETTPRKTAFHLANQRTMTS